MPAMMDGRNWFAAPLPARRRQLRPMRRDGVHVEIKGRRLLNFASNDYLGLAGHDRVRAAAAGQIEAEGFGSGASRLISGDHPLLHELEATLAAWKGYEVGLLLGSGMLANIGLLDALADRHSIIFADRRNHASLIDGARLSGARVIRYRHNDLDHLARLLAAHAAARRIVVSDGVFSMDGDCADVAGLIGLAEQHDALLVIDDAHGTGVCGPDGRGLTAAFAGHARLIEVGTLGKALGSYGAFILACRPLIEGLIQRLRTLIYSTALPPCTAAAALAALHELKKGALVARLRANIAFFRAQLHDLPLLPSATAIQPLILGEDEAALAAAAKLEVKGFFVPAIRPPTVPAGTARLRITLSAAHTREHIKALADALTDCCR